MQNRSHARTFREARVWSTLRPAAFLHCVRLTESRKRDGPKTFLDEFVGDFYKPTRCRIRLHLCWRSGLLKLRAMLTRGASFLKAGDKQVSVLRRVEYH